MSAGESVSPAGTQFVSADFGRLAFQRLGPTEGVPLLLCHRFRGTIDDWDPAFVSVLAAERDVVVFDGPGVGRSSGEPQSTVAEMASAVQDLVSRLGLEQIDLLGWSMGGFVAQQLALSEPRLVRRLIVAGSKPGLVPGAPAPAPEVGQVAGKPVNDDEDLLYLFFPESPDGRAAGLASLQRLSVTPSAAVVSAVGVQAQAAALTRWSSGTDSAWARLEELTMPVLVAAGAQDRLMDAYNSYAMVRRLPNANLIIYGDAGHAFLFQHAQAFGRQVLDFLCAP
jgi:pimeloyl-ACP methyl ester carboxylesterase